MIIKKGLLILITIFLIGIFSISIFGQRDISGEAVTTGEFTIVGVAPNEPTEFAVKDGALGTDWDEYDNPDNVFTRDGLGTIVETHSREGPLRWKVSDANGDDLTSIVCISSNPALANPVTFDGITCDILLDDSTVTGNPARFTPAIVTSPNYLTPVEYAIDPVAFPLFDYNNPNPTYYVAIAANDGGADSTTALITSFQLINSIPDIPTTMIVQDESSGPYADDETHIRKPIVSWSFSDPDDGTVDRWPIDGSAPNPAFVHTIVVDDTTIGGNGLVDQTSLAATSIGSTEWITDIPWGGVADELTPGRVHNVVQVRITTLDGHTAGISPNFDTTFDLVDHIPDILDPITGPTNFGLQIQDSAGPGLATCTAVQTAGLTCPVAITTASIFDGSDGFTGIEANVKFLDVDTVGGVFTCDGTNHLMTVYLCDETGIPTCDKLFVNKFTYGLGDAQYVSGDGAAIATACTYNIDITDVAAPTHLPDGSPPFFFPVNVYKLHVDISSESGVNRSDNNPGTDEVDLFWDVIAVPAINYFDLTGAGPVFPATALVQFGTAGSAQADQWNPGDRQYQVMNQGNLDRFAQWEISDFCSTLIPLGEFGAACTALANSNQNQIWQIAETGVNPGSKAPPNFVIDNDNACFNPDCSDPAGDPDIVTLSAAATTVNFPTAALSVCTDQVCTGAANDEDTFYHIAPQGPLNAETFQAELTFIDA